MTIIQAPRAMITEFTRDVSVAVDTADIQGDSVRVYALPKGGLRLQGAIDWGYLTYIEELVPRSRMLAGRRNYDRLLGIHFYDMNLQHRNYRRIDSSLDNIGVLISDTMKE